MTEHVILVAATVEAPDRKAAELALHVALPAVTGEPITSWWIAEDERYDRSDNDSAVFVKPGRQQEATAVLRAAGLAY